MTLLLDPSKANWLDQVLSIFETDEPVALPTETVYGLAAPIDRPRALARIFELKQRPEFNPLIIHVKKDWNLEEWVEWQSIIEKKLVEDFWPGPLSILLKKTPKVPDLCTASSPFVVMRAPSNPFFQKVLETLGVPLAAPSANTSTQTSPTSAMRVLEDLGQASLKAVVDGGRCPLGLESTIVRVREGCVEILREGAISREQFIEQGYKLISSSAHSVNTPGQQAKHYSPKIPLVFAQSVESWLGFHPESLEIPYLDKNKAILFLKILESDAPDSIPNSGVKNYEMRILDQSDSLMAAHELFEVMRWAEKKYAMIVALKTEERGVGMAINDRLLRASSFKI